MNLTNHVRRGLLAVIAATVGLGAAGTTTHANSTPTATPLMVPATTTSDRAPLATVAAPTRPRSVTATPRNTRVRLRWLAPASNGGSPVDKYRVQRARAGGRWRTIASPTTRTYTAKGLANGTRYSFRVRAHNRAGWGSFSPAVKAVPRTVPSAPTAVGTNPSYKHVTLAWAAPAGNGAKIDKYEVQQSTSSNTGWTRIAGSAFPTTTTATATGLSNGTKYYFRIRAHNAAGWGQFSYPVNAVPYWTPDAPATCTAVPSSPGSVWMIVSWQAPAFDGGAPIESYDISLWRLGKEYDRTTIKMPVNNLVATMEVNAFGKWDVQVQARNAAGLSLPCSTSVTM